MFTNSGMVQFKGIFVGTEDSTTSFGMMKRAVDTQKVDFLYPKF